MDKLLYVLNVEKTNVKIGIGKFQSDNLFFIDNRSRASEMCLPVKERFLFLGVIGVDNGLGFSGFPFKILKMFSFAFLQS